MNERITATTFGKKVIDEKKQGGYNTNQQQILQEAAYEH